MLSALVLRTISYSDKAHIVVLFSELKGKHSALHYLTKGRSSGLATAHFIQYALKEGRGSLPSLTDASPDASTHQSKLNGDALLVWWFAVELMHKLCPEGEPQPVLFTELKMLYIRLEQGIFPALPEVPLIIIGRRLGHIDPTQYRFSPELQPSINACNIETGDQQMPLFSFKLSMASLCSQLALPAFESLQLITAACD